MFQILFPQNWRAEIRSFNDIERYFPNLSLPIKPAVAKPRLLANKPSVSIGKRYQGRSSTRCIDPLLNVINAGQTQNISLERDDTETCRPNPDLRTVVVPFNEGYVFPNLDPRNVVVPFDEGYVFPNLDPKNVVVPFDEGYVFPNLDPKNMVVPFDEGYVFPNLDPKNMVVPFNEGYVFPNVDPKTMVVPFKDYFLSNFDARSAPSTKDYVPPNVDLRSTLAPQILQEESTPQLGP